MINILMLYKDFNIGGAENLILNLSNELDSSKYHISIAAAFQQQIESSKLKIYNIKKSRIKFITYINYIKQIYQICKDDNVDIIHSHHRFTTMICLIIKLIIKVRLVHTEHNVFPDKNFVNLRGHNIVAVSESVKNHMIKSKIKESDICTIYNGINKDKYINAIKKDLKEELRIQRDKFCFGFIGRLHNQKGVMYLLDAFRNLVLRGYNCNLIIIGDGPLKDIIIKYIEDNKLEKEIYLLGFRSDIINILHSLDVYVLPSIYEGFPMINMEIMVNKKILIATDVGGNKEIIEDTYNGYIVKSRSSNELLNRMEYIIKNKSILNKMGEMAQETIINNFTTEIMCEKYSNYYERILNN